MCVMEHPGPAKRFEDFDSIANALARQAFYVQNGDPHWVITYDCDGNQIGSLSAAAVAATAGDPFEGPPGATVAARWVPVVPMAAIVAGTPLMPPGAAAVVGLVAYGNV